MGIPGISASIIVNGNGNYLHYIYSYGRIIDVLWLITQ